MCIQQKAQIFKIFKIVVVNSVKFFLEFNGLKGTQSTLH